MGPPYRRQEEGGECYCKSVLGRVKEEGVLSLQVIYELVLFHISKSQGFEGTFYSQSRITALTELHIKRLSARCMFVAFAE